MKGFLADNAQAPATGSLCGRVKQAEFSQAKAGRLGTGVAPLIRDQESAAHGSLSRGHAKTSLVIALDARRAHCLLSNRRNGCNDFPQTQCNDALGAAGRQSGASCPDWRLACSSFRVSRSHETRAGDSELSPEKKLSCVKGGACVQPRDTPQARCRQRSMCGMRLPSNIHKLVLVFDRNHLWRRNVDRWHACPANSHRGVVTAALAAT
jgi:hypothetical protein